MTRRPVDRLEDVCGSCGAPLKLAASDFAHVGSWFGLCHTCRAGLGGARGMVWAVLGMLALVTIVLGALVLAGVL